MGNRVFLLLKEPIVDVGEEKVFFNQSSNINHDIPWPDYNRWC